MAIMDVKIYSNSTIETLAETVLAHTGFSNICGIDIIQLANVLGLNVYSKGLEGSSGYIKYEDKNYNIYVNEFDSRNRRRFTIAHELGHFLLHRSLIEQEGSTVLYRTSMTNRDIIEIQANRCAAALLMPKDLVKQAFNEANGASFEKLIILANKFNVSVDAMYTRLSILGLLE